MMLDYLLRATIVWSAFLVFYWWFRPQISFNFQRVTLLIGWLAGLTIPLLPPMGSEALPVFGSVPGISLSLTKTITTNVAEVTPVVPTWQWTDLLPWIYCTGLLVLTARALVQSWRTSQCLAEGKRSSFAGYPVITSSRVNSPFAARGYVFLPEGLSSDLTRTALLHETAHLRARHHYDKTLMTLSSILLWFHPLTWAYQRLLATIHEHEADAAVLQTLPARTYGLQLLQCHIRPARSLGLFSSPLKQRIEMITTSTKRQPRRITPFFALLFLLTTLTFACSDLGQSAAAPAEEVLTESVEGPEMPTATVDREFGFYGETDNLQASIESYLKDIYQNIKYPAAARATSTTGKFRATLRLGVHGKIETLDVGPFTDELAGGPPMSPEIVIVGYTPEKAGGPKVPELLTEEISRVLSTLDNFSPMLVGGQPRGQTLNIDFTFKLEQ